MYISYKWLQDYIKLPNKIGYKEVAQAFINHTVEVESIKNQAESLDSVVVGRVLEVKPHPNADKLRIAQVDVKKEVLQIVCGAKNLATDQLVPVALEGAVLGEDFEIKKTKIRGESSNGMICSEDELGVGTDKEGIMVLEKRAKVGQEFSSYLKADDYVFEIDNKSLSNRPDLFCHYGLARELSAIYNLDLEPYNKNTIKITSAKLESEVKIEIEAKEQCPRYSAVRVDNIKVGPSPQWLRERLIAIGQKPVNNIVDLANYVMFDYGQPLHTFSADKVKEIEVRLANEGETIEALDGKEYTLASNDLVITNNKEVIALAGIIGSVNSQIDEKSNSLVLESANFSGESIRSTARRLNLRTEASLRFEKSIDPELTTIAIERYLYLLKKVCPEMKLVSVISDKYPNKNKTISIDLNFAWLSQQVGQEIPQTEAIKHLKSLGFKVGPVENGQAKVEVPSWRAGKDVSSREDLVEEVLRIYGYNKIKSQLPKEELRLPIPNPLRDVKNKVKNILSHRYALTEVHNYSFVGEQQLTKLNVDFSNHLRLANPLSKLSSLLRQSLAPNLITNIKSNQAKRDHFGFFELGDVFFKFEGELEKGDGSGKLPYQEKRLGIILANNKNDIFSELKNITGSLLAEILGKEGNLSFASLENLPGWAQKEKSASVNFADESLGIIAQVDDKVASESGLKMNSAIIELNFSKLVDLIDHFHDLKLTELARYPAVQRDVCFVVSEEILYNDINQLIVNFHPLLKKVDLIDVYQGNKLEAGSKSFTFHLEFQDSERTLVSAEVEKIIKELEKDLADKIGAKIRNF